MGAFASCCKPSASDVMTPDAETRRRQQSEAAEKRRVQEDSRGVKDPARVKQQQQRLEDLEKEAKSNQSGPGLRWTTS